MSVEPGPVTQMQIADLLRGIDRRLDQVLTRMDRHDDRHAIIADTSEKRHEAVMEELHSHALTDEQRFGEINGMIKTRSTLGGIGIVLSALLTALGFKVGGGAP